VLALIAVFLAAFRDYSAHLAPGEQAAVAIIAADRKQAKVLLRYCVGLLRAVHMLAAMIDDELAESVTLKNGVVIEIHTGSISSPRGRTFIAVLADEIAFWRSEDSANPDADVIAAVRPGLASISILLMASSPYAKRGVLFTMFRRHFGKDGACAGLARHNGRNESHARFGYHCRSVRGRSGECCCRIWRRVSRGHF
jgi:hypothetical protein